MAGIGNAIAPEGLNDFEERFCREYIQDCKYGPAAIRAGAPEAGSRTRGYKLMARPEIQQRIAELFAEQQGPTDLLRRRMIREAACIAFSDVTEMVTIEDKPVPGDPTRTYRGVTILPTDQIPEHIRPAISSIKSGPNGIEVKFHDKTKGLELLGKLTGLTVDKLELTGAGGGPLLTQDMPTEHKNKLLQKIAQRLALE